MPTALKARLDVRLSIKQKKMIQEAAGLSGKSISDFVVASLVEAAEQVVNDTRDRVLSKRDSELFLAMLDADEPPNAALRRAAKRYEKKYGKLAD
jgi:uncharacterized protein (DUF1778 family)